MHKKNKKYVEHPIYGSASIDIESDVSLEKLLKSYWRYSSENIFPKSAIKADMIKQNYSMFPRGYYVDIEKLCRRCGRHFIFFAQEQRYWYEVLGFHIDADCIKCTECKVEEKKIKEKALRYEALIKNKNRSNRELKDLKYVAYDLYEIGYLKNKSKLAEILKLKENPKSSY